MNETNTLISTPHLCDLGGTMPPNTLESMLQTMMTSLFNPDERSIIVCSRCSKAKRTQGQQSSPTACKCDSNWSKRKHKRRSRKLRKSCLKTIVCVAKMAKNVGECSDCACHGCGETPTNEAEDERFCSKCGQLLPGENPVNLPSTDSTELEECRMQLELCRQECNETKNMKPSVAKATVVDTGVQVTVERKEPVTVRIRVCPCPNGTKCHRDLNQSRSEPDISKANITYDDYDISDVPQDSGSQTQFEDDNYPSPQPQPANSVGLRETSKWRRDIAIMKALALKMAKARMVEDAACWERVHASRMLQQQQDLPRRSGEAEGELSEALVNSRKTVEFDDGPIISRHAYLSVEDEPAAQPPGNRTRMSRATVIPRPSVYTAPQNPDVWNEYLGTVHYGQYPPQDMSVGCCTGTSVNCYSPENPSSYGGHCKNKCSCSNNAPFVPHQQLYGTSNVYSRFPQPSDQTFVHCNGSEIRESPHSS